MAKKEASGPKSGAELAATPQGAAMRMVRMKLKATRFVKDLFGITLKQRAKGRVVAAFKNKHVDEARREYRLLEVRAVDCRGLVQDVQVVTCMYVSFV